MISVVFALLTAFSNALASVLQRRAAAQAPPEGAFRLALVSFLVRQRVWLAGVGMTVVAAVCQAVALATGPVALVQPLFIVELPFALLVGGVVMHRRLSRRTWVAVGAVTSGLAVVLGCSAPSGGMTRAPGELWVLALIATGAFETVVLTVALRARGEARAALLGLAGACGYALTAALMKHAMAGLGDGAAAFFTTWQLYGAAAAGVGSLFLLQNALQAGSLVATQPMLTLGDALISMCYGGLLFDETIRFGWFLLPELVGLGVIVLGTIDLSRPLAAPAVARTAAAG